MRLKELELLSDKDLNEVIVLSKLIPDTVKGLFDVKKFRSLTYGDVIELKAIASSGEDDELIKKVAKLSGYNISNMLRIKAKQYFKTINDIEKEFIEIMNYEKLLQTPTDSKLISAGIEELNQFGELNIIDALAGGDILKWQEVVKLEWWDVFNKLLKNKKESDVKNLLELQRKTSK